jgi:GxxExxY protein
MSVSHNETKNTKEQRITPKMNDQHIERENELARLVLDVAFRIHKLYGPGLFESVYEEIFCFEWEKQSIPYQRQKAIPLVHESIKLDAGFRADLIIENKLLVEFKSVETLADIHFKQVQTYLKLTECKLGLLINFNVVYLKDGIKRIINTY